METDSIFLFISFFQNYLILIYTRNYYVTLYPGPICNYPINPYCKLSLCL